METDPKYTVEESSDSIGRIWRVIRRTEQGPSTIARCDWYDDALLIVAALNEFGA